MQKAKCQHVTLEYVQPSDYEGYCLALAEARILPLPCVCCDFAGAREQLRDGANGFVTGMTAEELYPKIKELAGSWELRKRFSMALEESGVSVTNAGYSEFREILAVK